jgi:Family of unknown function (DUF6069)
MTYPASPSDAAANRVRPDSAQFWAGAVATAVVAALIALVGILICRWTLHIPIMAPAGDGAWGNAHTGVYAVVAALIAVAAAGLLYLLVLSTPQPVTFFHWIMGLVTLAAVVYPFSTGAPLNQKFATAVVDLVLGLAISSLLTAVASRAIRRPVRPVRSARPGYADETGYGPGQAVDPGEVAGPDQGYRTDRGYEPDGGYPPGERRYPPTQPVTPPNRGLRRRR